MPFNCNLHSIWWEARRKIDPAVILALPRRDEAVLCWGKAAYRTWEIVADKRGGRSRTKAAQSGYPALLIAPHGAGPEAAYFRGARVCFGEHPLPGPGSFAAGRALIDFYDSIRRNENIRGLKIYLSGGASSLAWLPPAHLDEAALASELRALYAAPLTIEELNRRRARLCALKGGGAARWLRNLVGRASFRVSVDVISDVEPFGPEVVGSGPFWDGHVPHHVVLGNRTLVRAAAQAARARGVKILHAESGAVGTWQEISSRIAKLARKAQRDGKEGIILVGGEPQVSLDGVRRPGRGGRQSQMALALGRAFARELAEGEAEIFCTSSDGVDGHSGSSGSSLGIRAGRALVTPSGQARARESLRKLDSAKMLGEMGALIPAQHSGTNVQDLMMVRVGSKTASSQPT